MTIQDCLFYREKNIPESKVLDMLLKDEFQKHFTLNSDITFSQVCDDVMNIMSGNCVVVSLPIQKLSTKTAYCFELKNFFSEILHIPVSVKENIVRKRLACMSFKVDT